MIEATERWKLQYPGAAIGYLVISGVSNPESHPELDQAKADLEVTLRKAYGEFDRARLRSLPVLRAYADYYKPFGKTYHVQLQLESVVLKEKPIPSVAALVETMFMAELKNFLLTAIHDLERVVTPLTVDAATGTESYTRMNGADQITKENDMMISDVEGILSTIIYGPDKRTQVDRKTKNALYTVYAPKGIQEEQVLEHLHDIQGYVQIISPEVSIDALDILHP